MKNIIIILFLLLLSVGNASFADTGVVNVYARSWVYIGRNSSGLAHCEKYIKYYNQNIPWGARVYLRYGLSSDTRRPWQSFSESQMEAIAPYTWQSHNDDYIQYRTEYNERRDLNFIEFVFRIVLPTGTEYFDTGTNSLFGEYFFAEISKLPIEVTYGGGESLKNPFQELPVQRWLNNF